MRYRAELASHQAAFSTLLETARPDAPVPSCPGWTVLGLVEHLAGIHRWAAARAAGVPTEPDVEGSLAEHYQHSVGVLVQAFDMLDADADAEAWTLLDDEVTDGPRIGTVGFWHRRQANETLVHLWDLHDALGVPDSVGPEQWLDCLDEVVTVMHPRQVRLGRIEPPRVRIRFEVVEPSAALLLSGAADDAVEVVVRGPARTLALLAWGRANVDDPTLDVVGDREALAGELAASLTP